jgi:isopentenyl-diphosphate delta-isomerase
LSRSKRKWDHIQHALATGQNSNTGLEDIAFIHQSLPDAFLDQADLGTSIGELSLSRPGCQINRPCYGSRVSNVCTEGSK